MQFEVYRRIRKSKTFTSGKENKKQAKTHYATQILNSAEPKSWRTGSARTDKQTEFEWPVLYHCFL